MYGQCEFLQWPSPISSRVLTISSRVLTISSRVLTISSCAGNSLVGTHLYCATLRQLGFQCEFVYGNMDWTIAETQLVRHCHLITESLDRSVI